MGENLRLAFQGIWSHKLRSLLTMLGIIIGIASIIAIVSTIKGTNEQIKQNLIGAGNNVVEVQLCVDDRALEPEYEAIPEGVPVITEDVRDRLEQLETVESATLYRQREYTYNTYYQNTSFNGAITGIDDHYLEVYGYQVPLGRPFTQRDYDEYHKVALVDQAAASSLFNGENPVGKVIEISGDPFTVVGLVELTSTSEPVITSYSDYYTYVSSSSGTVLIPATLWPEIYQYDEPQNAAVRATSTDDMTTAGKKAAELLNANLSDTVDPTYTYQSTDLEEAARSLQQMSATSNQQLIWIASISLLVGGIGVMNIMLVSVTERTREIGLKKALGAKRGRILWQFLTEAAVLTSIGGLLGVVTGLGLARVISSLTGTPTAVSLLSILVAVLFSVVIGVAFGLLPAVKAANLNPIDALRRE
ncbi:MAG: ABC transporter permease [Clostridiales bacterium]|nr:ABC transporter permease [Clostridiales bacterium]